MTYTACFNNADLCHEMGDFEFVAYSLLYGVDQMFAAGEQLERVLARQRDMIAIFTKRKQAVIGCIHGMYVNLGKIAGIISPEADSAVVDGVLVSPAAILASFQADKVFMFEFAQHAYTTMFHYYQRDFQLATVSGEMGWQMFLRQGHSGAAGLTFNTDILLYYALTLLALAPLVAEVGTLAANGGTGEAGDSFDSVLAESNSAARRFDELEVIRQQIAGKSPVTPRSPHQQPAVNRSEAYRHLTVHVSTTSTWRRCPRRPYLSKVAAIQTAHRTVGDAQSQPPTPTSTPSSTRRGCGCSCSRTRTLSAWGRATTCMHATLKLYEKSIALSRINGDDARGGAGQRARSALLPGRSTSRERRRASYVRPTGDTPSGAAS